ncbi:hypothetical protein CHUAL_007895 [Chamberlinius hualienensis]
MAVATRKFTLAVIQLLVRNDKSANLKRACELLEEAAKNGSKIAALPECFNSPYGVQHFGNFAETIPGGETVTVIANMAKKLGIYIIGGSIPEKRDGKLYNTSTVFGPDGSLLAKFSKMHLFDIDIPGKITFKESTVLTAGNDFATFETPYCKVGIGICYDLRFPELAQIYAKSGCELIVYPGAFNMTTGPLHWDLLLRSRANDNQLFVAGVSPARDENSGYVAWGNSSIIDPWGKVIGKLDEQERILYAEIDLDEVNAARAQIPVSFQKRIDIYKKEEIKMDFKKMDVIIKRFGETLLLILIVLTSVGDGRPQLTTKNENLPQRFLSGARCLKCSPTESYRPICGSDGRTYANECELELMNCEGLLNIKRHHEGKCSSSESLVSSSLTTQGLCVIQRKESERKLKLLNPKVRGGDILHVPQCQKDGTFNEVQCHSNTNYCWCVDKISGQLILGSSTVGWPRPKCSSTSSSNSNVKNQLHTRDANGKRGSKSKKHPVRQECRKSDQTSFNHNLVKHIISEYHSFNGNSRTSGVSEAESLEKRALEWKFSMLDKNRNNYLEKKEMKTLKRMVRKIVKPNECAKLFPRKCDTDRNRKISQDEWVACLGGMNKEQTELPREFKTRIPLTLKPTGDSSSRRPADITPDSTGLESEDQQDCYTERQSGLELQKTSETAIYVAECDVDQKYSQIQCYAGYCWCVDRDTGKGIRNTTVQNMKPDCEKLIKALKHIKGCPSDKRQVFIKEFVEYLINDMKSSANYTTGTSTTHESQLDAVTKWKFDKLDININKVLDKNEWRELRKELKKKSVRKCGRNFIKLCDANNDKKIAYDEWIECFSIFKEFKVDIPRRRQKGQNPLDKYLKND